MELGVLAKCKRSLAKGLTLAALVGGAFCFHPSRAQAYDTNTIHPALVQTLNQFYQPSQGVVFVTDKVKTGSINEDSPNQAYARALHHFQHWQTNEGLLGFSSVYEWATHPEVQAAFPFGDHTWQRAVDDVYTTSTLGDNFGYLFHLISDLTVPAHVRADTHILVDSYEAWTSEHMSQIMGKIHPQNIPQFDNLQQLMDNLAHATGAMAYSDDSVDGTISVTEVSEGNRIYYVNMVEGKTFHVLRKGFFFDYPDTTCLNDTWTVSGRKAVEYGAAAIKLLEKEAPCVANCSDKECGDDGCGGICGQCAPELFCNFGTCLEDCIADCTYKHCGDDGCGGSCGVCDEGYFCNFGKCSKECSPDCDGKVCGSDGCGGSCGSCSIDYSCVKGVCVEGCQPSCLGKQCGDDGCGGDCGSCSDGKYCAEGICKCNTSCQPGETTCVSPDIGEGFYTCLSEEQNGCMSWSGYTPCDGDSTCINGQCVPPICNPNCNGKECGNDGCGGSCGTCDPGQYCDYLHNSCSDSCTDQCPSAGYIDTKCAGTALRVCGDFGGNGGCLEWKIESCPAQQYCVNGVCKGDCVPDCNGKECGGNGCGGSCGSCGPTEYCDYQSGTCTNSCSDQCPSLGYIDPMNCNGTALHVCGNFDSDSCLEWGSQSCPSGYSCSGGSCVSSGTCETPSWIYVSSNVNIGCGACTDGCAVVYNPAWYGVCLQSCTTNSDCNTYAGFNCKNTPYETSPTNSKLCLLTDCTDSNSCNSGLSCVLASTITDNGAYATAKFLNEIQLKVCYNLNCLGK